MRRALMGLTIAVAMISSTGALATPDLDDAYIPSHVCNHVFAPTTVPDTQVCQFQLAPGARQFNLDMVETIGGSGSFRMQAAFEDGVVFFEAACSRDDEGTHCSGQGWYYGGRGVTSSRFSGTGLIVLVLLQDGVTASMPAGGSLTVWAGPGQLGGFAVRSDG